MTDIEIFYVAFFIFFVLPIGIVLWALILDHQSTTNREMIDHQLTTNRPPMD